MAYYGAGGSAFGGFPGGYSIGPGGGSTPNFSGPGVPLTIGANLPAVDPNNFSGTVHFGPPVTHYGQFPPGVNAPDWNAGYGGGANFYPGYGGGANFYPGY